MCLLACVLLACLPPSLFLLVGWLVGWLVGLARLGFGIVLVCLLLFWPGLVWSCLVLCCSVLCFVLFSVLSVLLGRVLDAFPYSVFFLFLSKY